MNRIALLTVTLLLAACGGRETRPEAGRDGDVGVSMVAVPSTERMVLPDNERFEYPLPDPANRFPRYPDDQLVDELPPIVVCVALSVGEEGQVFRIDPMQEGDDCVATADAPEPFRQAVFDALGYWRFEPAFRCVYPEGVQPGALGCIEPAEVVPVAVRLPYRFVFEQRDGQGIVAGQ